MKTLKQIGLSLAIATLVIGASDIASAQGRRGRGEERRQENQAAREQRQEERQNRRNEQQAQQQQQQSFNDTYTALILEEAEKLYNELTTKLTNWSYRSNCNY